MEHIHSQLILHQRQQYAQLRALATGDTQPDPMLPQTFPDEEHHNVFKFQMEGFSHLTVSNGVDGVASKKLQQGALEQFEMPNSEGRRTSADGSETAEDKGNEDPLLEGRPRKFEVPLSDETGEEDQESEIDDQESGITRSNVCHFLFDVAWLLDSVFPFMFFVLSMF